MTRIYRDLLGSGVRIRLAEDGPADGPPILFFHGAFVDARTWQATSGILSDEFRSYCPDLPGFGDSEKPPPHRFPYGIDAFTEAMVDLYGGLGIGRAAVIGQGLGAAVAITLASRHPELVSRLVLIDAVCRPAPYRAMERMVLLPFVGGLLFKQLLGRAAYREFFRTWLVSSRSIVSLERMDDYFEKLSTPAARGSLLATLRASHDTRPIVAQTVRLCTPTLVLWGRFDRLQPPYHGQRLAREIRGAGFELLDAGHRSEQERPEQVADLVRRFLHSERTKEASSRPPPRVLQSIGNDAVGGLDDRGDLSDRVDREPGAAGAAARREGG